MHGSFQVHTSGQGLYEITHNTQTSLSDMGGENGLVNVFIQHTSASLIIQENADPSAKHDLEVWLRKLVPSNNLDFTHLDEGPDDMPSHIKSALTQTSILIPVIDGKLGLGTWQGIYLWEHRDRPHNRNLLITFIGSSFYG